MTTTRKWSLLTALLIVALFVGSWFLLIAPKRSEAADLHSQTDQQEQANAQLLTKLQELKALSQDLPKQKAQLAVIKQQLPDNPALPSLVRSLTKAARKTGVELTTLTPSVPIALAAPAATTPVAPAPAASSAASGTDSSATGAAGTTGTTGAAAPAVPTTTLYQVPLAIKVSGSYFQLEQFVGELEKLRRAFLVTGFSLQSSQTGPTSSTTTGSSTTSATDDLTLDLSGRVFISAAASVAPTATTPTAAASTAATTQ